MSKGAVYVIGTFDTKAAELLHAAERVRASGARVITVDVSTAEERPGADITARNVAEHHPAGAAAVLGHSDRGEAVAAMAEALTMYLGKQTRIGAVLGLGGSGNTSIVTQAMRALPIGVPKLMVSTVASGNVAPFVGGSDIMMMHAVADVAGLNDITRAVIGNAAHAAAGMALNPVPQTKTGKRTVGLTMFGVTTSAITQIRERIGDDAECLVFHATGIGGQCMEKLIDSGYIQSAIDLTTTEVADHLFGGVLPCTEDRFGAVIRTGIPYVGSVGAVDMINFGPRNTIPERHSARAFHIHNPVVTLMRTTPQECAEIGQWIVTRCNQMKGPVRFLLPLRGVSTIDVPGQPFHDPEADAALFHAIRSGWKAAPHRKLIDVDAHINDAVFADCVAEAFHEIVRPQ